MMYLNRRSCDWSVKDNDNESNSQHTSLTLLPGMGCDWSVKDNDNESNSQLLSNSFYAANVVIGLSKIMIMKAIHNSGSSLRHRPRVVIGLSKIMIMKAIHNRSACTVFCILL